MSTKPPTLHGSGDWQSNFGIEAPFALGVEEELLLVGPNGELLERGAEVVRDGVHVPKSDVIRAAILPENE